MDKKGCSLIYGTEQSGTERKPFCDWFSANPYGLWWKPASIGWFSPQNGSRDAPNVQTKMKLTVQSETVRAGSEVYCDKINVCKGYVLQACMTLVLATVDVMWYLCIMWCFNLSRIRHVSSTSLRVAGVNKMSLVPVYDVRYSPLEISEVMSLLLNPTVAKSMFTDVVQRD